MGLCNSVCQKNNNLQVNWTIKSQTPLKDSVVEQIFEMQQRKELFEQFLEEIEEQKQEPIINARTADFKEEIDFCEGNTLSMPIDEDLNADEDNCPAIDLDRDESRTMLAKKQKTRSLNFGKHLPEQEEIMSVKIHDLKLETLKPSISF